MIRAKYPALLEFTFTVAIKRALYLVLLKLVNKKCLVKKTGVTPNCFRCYTRKEKIRMPKNPRRHLTFSEETTAELVWLLDDERRKRKKERKKGQFHESHLLAQLIHNEKVIRTAFK